MPAPDDHDLASPPTEIDLAQLLNAVRAALGPSSALVLRRLAFERDRLRGCAFATDQARAGLRMLLGEPDDGPQPAFTLSVLAAAWKARAEKAEAALRPFAAAAAECDRHGHVHAEGCLMVPTKLCLAAREALEGAVPSGR